MSAAAFNAKIADFARRLPAEKVEPFQKKIAMEVLSRVVLKTPVDTGRARANWQVSLTGPTGYDKEDTDRGGAATINSGIQTIEHVRAYQTIWIGNNLEYIVPLEFGWSRQAPQGMLRLTLAEISSIFP